MSLPSQPSVPIPQNNLLLWYHTSFENLYCWDCIPPAVIKLPFSLNMSWWYFHLYPYILISLFCNSFIVFPCIRVQWFMLTVYNWWTFKCLQSFTIMGNTEVSILVHNCLGIFLQIYLSGILVTSVRNQLKLSEVSFWYFHFILMNEVEPIFMFISHLFFSTFIFFA